MTAARWHGVNVFYYDGNKDGLVVDAVRPLFARVGDAVGAAYFVRHWRRGPHVRLLFHTDDHAFADTVRPAVDEVVGAFLTRHPSRVVVDENRLLALHQRLAEAEAERGPLSPLMPDNRICAADHDPRLHTLGSRHASELLNEFYVVTNDLAFAMTEHARAGGSRLWPCFDLMVATADTLCENGLRSGYVSFRSHAEGFLGQTGQASRVRAEWDRRFGPRASALAGRVARIVSGAPVPFVAEWLAAVDPVRVRAAPLITAGEVALPAEPLADGRRPVSAFHEALARDETYLTQVRDSPWFQRYRLMLNFLYLHMTRLGVSPRERFLLCHLAANAAEQVLGCLAD